MKFIISRQELGDLTNRIQNIVAPKSPVLILSNFLIEAIDNQVIITATDLTVGVRCSMPAKVIEPGSITIPAKRFSSLIRELTTAHIEVRTQAKEMITITAESSTFKMHGLPIDEFPKLPDFQDAAQIRMKQSELKEMFFRTAFAVSKEDSRYILTGVSLQIVNNIVMFVGTDGKRLARAGFPLATEPMINAECIIPLKAVDEIVKNLNDPEEESTLFILQDKIAVESGSMLIVTKLLSGDYPDVNKVIPQATNSSVSLHKDELMSLLRQVSLFTTEKHHSVRFTFTPGELNLSVNTMDLGEGKVSMAANYDGPRFDIAFNPMYFLDILRHSKQETISISFSDPYNPTLITDGEHIFSVNSVLPSPLFILMPTRLNESVG